VLYTVSERETIAESTDAVHRGFVAGRYRDWSWSDIWTDVARCAPGTFTGVAAACTCGWRGSPHPPSISNLQDCHWEWVFLHVVSLPVSASGDGVINQIAADEQPS
jgi:hypothetical protein